MYLSGEVGTPLFVGRHDPPEPMNPTSLEPVGQRGGQRRPVQRPIRWTVTTCWLDRLIPGVHQFVAIELR
jgi:hypothetical protein